MPHITAHPIRIGYAPHGKLFTIPAYTVVTPARNLPHKPGQRRYWVDHIPDNLDSLEAAVFVMHYEGHGILVDQCNVIRVSKQRHAELKADPILAILNSNPTR
jgi:hypothetical protein